jgi:acyl-coenzyme A synthetase/AMP-(fatty) acid ligase
MRAHAAVWILAGRQRVRARHQRRVQHVGGTLTRASNNRTRAHAHAHVLAHSDIGWLVGHIYMVYAPLLHGCTSVMFEVKPVEPLVQAHTVLTYVS